MRERLSSYIDFMENAVNKELSNELSKEEKETIIKDFLIQIKFFQHERLIHLIVTVSFALIAIISVLFNTVLQNLAMLIFILGMLIMLLFYIRHYFFLERGVQKLYTLYDKLNSAK